MHDRRAALARDDFVLTLGREAVREAVHGQPAGNRDLKRRAHQRVERGGERRFALGILREQQRKIFARALDQPRLAAGVHLHDVGQEDLRRQRRHARAERIRVRPVRFGENQHAADRHFAHRLRLNDGQRVV